MKFHELTGDFTTFQPDPTKLHFVVHVVNNRGIAGSGAVLAVKKNFPKAIQEYSSWYEGLHTLDSFPKCLDQYNSLFEMGNIQVVGVAPNIKVVNALAQKGFGDYGMAPGRYESIEECLRKLKVCCEAVLSHSNLIPQIEACKFGSLRSGLSWDRVFDMVQDIFDDVDGIWNTYSYEEKSAIPSYYSNAKAAT